MGLVFEGRALQALLDSPCPRRTVDPWDVPGPFPGARRMFLVLVFDYALVNTAPSGLRKTEEPPSASASKAFLARRTGPSPSTLSVDGMRRRVAVLLAVVPPSNSSRLPYAAAAAAVQQLKPRVVLVGAEGPDGGALSVRRAVRVGALRW